MINLYDLNIFLANSGIANRILDFDELDLSELCVSSQTPDGPYYISYYYHYTQYKRLIPDDIIKKFLRSKKLESL